MDALKTKKKVLKAALTRHKDKVQQQINSSDLIALKLLQNKISDLCNDFKITFDLIFEKCKEEDQLDYIAEKESIEDSIDELVLNIERKLFEIKAESERSVTPVQSTCSTVSEVKLPTLAVPTFNGKIENWIMFQDLFKSSVIGNKSISNAMKLQYLKASCKDEALRIINTISISDNNFDIAWKLLEDRYQNKRELVNTLIRKLMNQSNITESSSAILNLIDVTNECVRSLSTLNYKVENLSETMIIFIIVDKLDKSTRYWWEKELKDSDDFGTLEQLLSFLQRQARILESSKIKETKRSSNFQNKVTSMMTTSNARVCVKCRKNGFHELFKCPEFINMSVNDRCEFVRKHNLCYLCFSRSHSVRNCVSIFRCKKCSKKHSTLLHFENEQRNNVSNVCDSPPPPVFQAVEVARNPTAAVTLNPNAVCFDNSGNSQVFTGTSVNELRNVKTVLLSTAIIYIKDCLGEFKPARALLDVGSMACFMTTHYAELLQIKKQKISISVSGLNGGQIDVKSKLKATISNKSDFEVGLEFLCVQKISNAIPVNYIKLPIGHYPENMKLADPEFYKPNRIDVLLGAEIYYQLLKFGHVRMPKSELTFQNSVFGFIASGCVYNADCQISSNSYCGLIHSIEEDLNTSIKRFWEIEHAFTENSVVRKSKEEIICEEHFLNTHRRDETGRYIVQFPLKEDPSCLGHSKEIARNRLNVLWKRLNRDPELLKLYRDFLEEYEAMGHMHLVNESYEPKITYYMPHQGVLRPQNSTTKLRVVFDASQESSSGVSLNSLQFNGGLIQEDLWSIMTRFRKHHYAFVADINKMYRTILIDPSQRDLQRILWKETDDGPIKIFRLSTVTYGTTSAPYLATRTLKQLASDEENSFPLAAAVTKTDFFMDDILTGSGDLETAKALQNQLISLLASGGMKLHKWAANDPELLNNISEDYDAYSFTSENESKALGIFWKHLSDEFAFKVKIQERNVYTKRSVLSDIAKIFDPLGLIGPVITKAKVFMQILWLLRIGWNDPLPEKESQEWQKFVMSLEAINHVAVKRCILVKNPHFIQLFGFSDACEYGYGAAIYIKSISSNGEITVHLVCSKSKVAPLKQITIPRLELSAAVLLSQLIQRVVKSLQLDISEIHLFSDSTIVLAWIKTSPHLLKTFVANRVATVQELTSSYTWHHVRSERNPADLVCRGVDPAKFLHNDFWWFGPNFIRQCDFSIHSDPVTDAAFENGEFSNELKGHSKTDQMTNQNLNVLLTVKCNNFIRDILEFSNNYIKIIRILSYICRFCYNARKSQKPRKGPLSAGEIKEAEEFLVREIQKEVYFNEISNLCKGRQISISSKLKNLNVYLDNKQILRVGGRLRNSNLNFMVKHPIILPYKSKFTEMLVEYFHRKYFHVGPQTLLNLIRQEFWPINGRSLCRKIAHSCVTCFKSKPITGEQIMADLPSERVNKTFPFNVCGVDFCGPFMIKYKTQRKGSPSKIYVAIFICFVTRAVHLEVVSDLTTEAFIASLKRFFSRRGKSTKIFSDNAKNFVGANSELKKIFNLVKNSDEKLARYLASEGIEWKFLPPRAPNFGGLWEAGVKSFKHHLKRVMGSSIFTLEEFETITVQVEGILNSRPITPLSSDVNDLEALTPAHFLIGRPITAIVEPELIELKDNRLSRWQKTTKVTQYIWKRWRRDYLNTLQQRTKWIFEKDNVKLNSVVVIKEDYLPVCKWPLGRIVKVYPGVDNKIRVVDVKTQNGVFKRPVTKICVLPIDA